MPDDPRETARSRFDRTFQSFEADRQYRRALANLEQLTHVVEALEAADAEVARLDRVWRKYTPEPTNGPIMRVVRRITAEIARLMPWRRRLLQGATMAALSRQADLTRVLVGILRSEVISYSRSIAPFVVAQVQTGAATDGIDLVRTAVDAMATDWLTRWESLAAREQRYEARAAALTRAYEELRDAVALEQQSTLSLRRAMEALATGDRAPAAPAASAGAPAAPENPDAYKYVTFEERFRGSPEDIRRRLTDYMPLFAGASNVIDVGCGRGELLDLFRERGISARGLDLNREMVDACLANGLNAERADALTWLTAQPDESVGGLTAVQVVEHMESPYLMRFIDMAHRKLKPGATIVLETVNVACWAAFFESFLRDFTHVRALHPETLRYLVQAGGFSPVAIQYRSPVDETDKLPTLRLPVLNRHAASDDALVDVVDALNAHAEKLNARLFTCRDYAVIGRKPFPS